MLPLHPHPHGQNDIMATMECRAKSREVMRLCDDRRYVCRDFCQQPMRRYEITRTSWGKTCLFVDQKMFNALPELGGAKFGSTVWGKCEDGSSSSFRVTTETDSFFFGNGASVLESCKNTIYPQQPHRFRGMASGLCASALPN
jgi:hypothetical protein